MARSDGSAFRRPTEERLAALAADLDFSLDEGERADYRTLVDGTIEGMEPIRHARGFDPGLRPADLAGRDGGRRPTPEEDPLNAWIRKTSIVRTDEGPLAGVTVGLKDSIALAGVELTLGSSVLEGFVPQIDAPVISRLLDAGAEIVGKTNMDSFACSGTGDVSDFGLVRNPRDTDHLAGGSSSGSGAAPANGECDVALGTDQAGSVRIPSSWCGLVGLKPTHGLVPYTGVVPFEQTIDHVGPMARDVETVARVLDAIAGRDVADGVPLDARQPADLEPDDYVGALGTDVSGRSIGLLREGFEWPALDPAVDETVRAALGEFESLGVEVEETSVPRHANAVSAWGPIATQGGARLLRDGGAAVSQDGWTWPRLARVLDSFRRARADDLPPSVKRTLLAAAFLDAEYGPEPYAKARSVGMATRRDYDAALESFDALAMPTTLNRAIEVEADLDRVGRLSREFTAAMNTCAFNLTGHPAISVPCGAPDGRPVGLMLVGARGADATLLALADAFERAVDWTAQ